MVGVFDNQSDVDSDTVKSVTAECPEGSFVIGGGAYADGGDSQYGAVITKSYINGNGWTAEAREHTGPGTTEDWSVTAYAICVNPDGFDA